MHKVSLALAVVGTSMTMLAQNCNTAPPASSRCTYDPPQASFYYPPTAGNSLTEFLDLNLQSPVTVTSIDLTTYAQGAGNPVVPTQVGNIAQVRIYLRPGTRIGFEGAPIDPSWVEVTRGEMTVVAWNAYSPVSNFKNPITGVPTPLVLDPANPLHFDAQGNAGVAIEIIPTSYYLTPLVVAANVGSIPVIGFVDPTPSPTFGDQFMTISNHNIRNNGWWTVSAATTPANDVIPNAAPTGVSTGRPNICIRYTPAASSAISIPFGVGCYDGRRMIHELFPAGLGGPNPAVDLVNSSYTLSLQSNAVGNFYNIVKSGVPYTVPTGGTDITQGAFTVSSSADWDDASVDVAITSGPIAYPGNPTGVTTISVNSNGKIYFGSMTDPSFAANGSNYGGIGPFRDLQASICAFNTDLDPRDPAFPRPIIVEQPSPNLGGIRITWVGLPNWPYVAGVTNDIQLEIAPGGGLIFLSYGANLATSGSASGNSGLVGFSAGGGQSAPPQIDWSAIPTSPPGINSGDGSVAPTLTMAGRPVAGTTKSLVIGNLMPATNGFFAGFVTASLSYSGSPGPLAPLSLGQFGLPGCGVSIGIAPTLFTVFLANPSFPATPTSFNWNWTIPTGTNGIQVFFQGGTLTPGQNPAGILVTNALCAKIGT